MRHLRRMLRHIVSLAFTAVILIPLAVAVGAQERHDGHMWAALSKQMKISYIQGVTDGSTLGAILAKEGLPEGDACQDKITPAYSKSAQKILAAVSPAQIADGVDSVFKDKQNESVLMADAVYIALKSIAGTPPEEIEKLLQAARITAQKPGK